MYRHREFRMVETERLTVSEWTSEGGLERVDCQVGADGTPPVIHRGTYDGTCKRVDILQEMSIWVVSQKYYAFVPCMGTEAFFSFWKHSQSNLAATARERQTKENLLSRHILLLCSGKADCYICHPKQISK